MRAMSPLGTITFSGSTENREASTDAGTMAPSSSVNSTEPSASVMPGPVVSHSGPSAESRTSAIATARSASSTEVPNNAWTAPKFSRPSMSSITRQGSFPACAASAYRPIASYERRNNETWYASSQLLQLPADEELPPTYASPAHSA